MAEEAYTKPNYLYKLVPSSAPVPEQPKLPKALPVSDIDKASGFIHLSTAPQVAGTLKFFFGQDKRVYVLRIEYDHVADKIKWEDPKAEVCGPRGGEGMFPHLYNELQLGKDEIERVEILERGEESWDQPVYAASAEWLVW
ncbi:hypothetical protein EW146_g7336 [Bondarzewia mesenterica]|uniref:DUF952 domain-containing protein n=1 Tax=Bondarzewia mesenterica TaxID=1095465 RepID=A0A4S4LL25_9AGAM|nr:hypothetical protein EW146_g7336 [Bondarzewia mesenterica]